MQLSCRKLFLILYAILPLYIPSNVCGEQAILYGEIARKTDHKVLNAVMEHVVLYPQEIADKPARIARPGMLLRYKDAKATIVICHGFMCNKEDVAFLRHLFAGGAFNILTFDFRAHGQEHHHQYCTFGHDEALDVAAAAQFIKNHPDIKDLPLFVYGFSMGAVASIQAQAQQPLFDAMILDCPFAASEKVVKKALANMKVTVFGYEFDMPGKRLLEKYAFHPYVQSVLKLVLKVVAHMDTKNIRTNIKPIHPVESVKNITIPCFFIHCKNDERIPLEDVRLLFDNAAGYKKMWITNGRHHYDSFFYNPELYHYHINHFLNQILNNTLPTNDVQEIIEDPDDSIKTV